jgi:hypothetical protein
MIRKLAFLFLFAIPASGFAKFGYDLKDLCFYYGQSYRINDRLYPVFDISYEHYRKSCLRKSFEGAGIRLDHFGDGNFSIAPKVFKSFQRRPDHEALLYYGIAPVLFRFEGIYGLNVKPEAGARFYYMTAGAVGLSLNISYSYEIPVLSENAFTSGRHDIAARAAICLDVDVMKGWFRKKKEEGKEGTDESKEATGQ